MNVLSDKQQRARKGHDCDLCHEAIDPGTIYRRQFCIECGDTWTFRGHIGCWEVAIQAADTGIDEPITDALFDDAIWHLSDEHIASALAGCSDEDCARIHRLREVTP